MTGPLLVSSSLQTLEKLKRERRTGSDAVPTAPGVQQPIPLDAWLVPRRRQQRREVPPALRQGEPQGV